MSPLRFPGGLAWLGVGLAVGLGLAGFWPQSPLHAVATDRIDSFAIATGAIDDGVEAIYFLDFLTGDLQAAIISRQSGKFNAFYHANVFQAVGADPTRSPRFLMVTGLADVRRGGTRTQTARSVVYVAEVTTGRVAAYAVPWGQTTAAGGQIIQQPLVLMDVTAFRAPPVLGQR